LILNKKLMIVLSIIFLVITALFLFNFSTVENEKVVENSEQPPQAEEEFADINLSLYNKNKTVKLELRAESLARYKDKNLLKMNPVEIKAYNIEDKKESSQSNLLYNLKGEEGNYQKEKGLLTISGMVTIKRSEKKFSFSKIIIDEDNSQVTAIGNVILETGEMVIKADKFKSNLALDYFDFFGIKDQASLNWKGIDASEK